MFKRALTDLQAGFSLHRVWIFQAYHELSAKYKRTILGSLWIAGSMVTTSLSLSIVFGGLFGQSLQEALPYMMGGILCFTMVSFIMVDAAEMFLGAGGIIKNHAYPFTYYAFENVSRAFMVFLHNLAVYLLTMAAIGALKIPHWSLILGIPIVLVTMLSWGTLIGMLSARFRDLRFLMPYLSQLLFFMTPIFWRADQLKGMRRIVADANPLYGLVEVVRAPLLGHMAPTVCWIQALASMGIGVVLWFFIFSAFRRRIPFWV